MTNDSVSLLVLQPGGWNLWPDGTSRTDWDQGSGPGFRTRVQDPGGRLTPVQLLRTFKVMITVIYFHDQGHDHPEDQDDHEDHEDPDDHHDYDQGHDDHDHLHDLRDQSHHC